MSAAAPPTAARTSEPRVTFDPTVFLATGVVLVGLGIQLRRGRFDNEALAAAVVATVLAMVVMRGRDVLLAPAASASSLVRTLVRGLVLLQLVAFVPVMDEHLLDDVGQPGTIIAGGLLVLMAIAAWDQLADEPMAGRWGSAVLVGAVGGLGLLWVWSNPAGIDVMIFQRVGVERLLNGENPWAPGYPNPHTGPLSEVFYGPGLAEGDRLNFGYPYPPLALLFALPGALVGQLRVMHLLAMLGAGTLILTMVRDSWASRAGGVLFLTIPLMLRVVEFSFTEAFMVLTLAAALWTLRRGTNVASVVALGLFLASKQYAVLFLPVILWVAPTLRTNAERWWVTWRAVLVAAAITVPPALWNVGDFVFSVGILQFQQPFRPDSLSLLAFSVNRWEFPPEGTYLLVILTATLAGLAWVLARAPRTWWGVAGGIGTVQLAFLIVNKQAFTNYYFFAAAALCAAVALRDAPIHSPRIGSPATAMSRADWTDTSQ